MLEIRQKVDLAPYTTFKIGGRSSFFVDINTESELREALDFARQKQINFFVLSGGTNVLLDDNGFNGLVIHMVGGGVKIYSNNVVTDAGAELASIIKSCGNVGLAGMERMYGIPGSVGGAVRGNAGAFGTEMKDVVSKVRVMNMQTGEVRDFNNKECEFDYRTSYFKTHPEWVVLTVVFKLCTFTDSRESAPSKPLSLAAHCPGFIEADSLELAVAELKRYREEILAKRGGKHDQAVRCAGSFFKNPLGTPETVEMFEQEKGVKARGGRVPAGWLIDKCELKGTTVGGAKCSEQQANYIVNFNNATQRDVLELRDIIIKKVQDTFSITLEPEVIVINT